MTINYFLSEDGTCPNETYRTPQVRYGNLDHHIVELYELVHLKARLDQPTGKSRDCVVTKRFICYYAMPSMDVLDSAGLNTVNSLT